MKPVAWQVSLLMIRAFFNVSDVDYTVSGVQGPYKALNNSPLFNLMEPMKLNETEYPDNLDKYKEVTAHQKVSHSFDEVMVYSQPI